MCVFSQQTDFCRKWCFSVSVLSVYLSRCSYYLPKLSPWQHFSRPYFQPKRPTQQAGQHVCMKLPKPYLLSSTKLLQSSESGDCLQSATFLRHSFSQLLGTLVEQKLVTLTAIPKIMNPITQVFMALPVWIITLQKVR